MSTVCFSVSEHELLYNGKTWGGRGVSLCVWGEPRLEKYWRVTRGSFLWSDNQVRR